MPTKREMEEEIDRLRQVLKENQELVAKVIKNLTDAHDPDKRGEKPRQEDRNPQTPPTV